MNLYGFICEQCDIEGWPELVDCPDCGQATHPLHFSNVNPRQVCQIRDALTEPGSWVLYVEDKAKADIK